MLLITDGFPRGLGYAETDHRACDSTDLPPGIPRHFECDTYTCSHCQFIVMKNPGRTRERYKCTKCQHHVCDNCAALMLQGGECKPFNAMVDEARERALRQSGSPTILLP